MSNRPRIFIGTLFSGENEFEEGVESLKNQNYTNWIHEVYKHLPNKKAHNTLYERFMELQDQYDLFIKMDGDMVFKSNEVLNIIVNHFENNPDLDQLTTKIQDWFTDTRINGMHSFSNRVLWKKNNEKLFVDPKPEFSGIHMIINPEEDIIIHSPNPSDFQAFHFGFHRTIKALQRNNFTNFKWVFARQMRKFLKNLYKNYKRTGEERLIYSLAGCKYIFDDVFEDRHYDYTNNYLKDFFDENREKILSEKNDIIKFMEKDFDRLYLKKTFVKFIASSPKEITSWLLRKQDRRVKIIDYV